MRGETWRNAAAFGTWIVVALPQLAGMATGRISGPRAVEWLAGLLILGLALTPILLLEMAGRGRLTLALLMIQTAAGLSMMATSGSGTASATLVIVAAEVAAICGPAVTWTWVAAQTV